jgi:hypothetical protein
MKRKSKGKVGLCSFGSTLYYCVLIAYFCCLALIDGPLDGSLRSSLDRFANDVTMTQEERADDVRWEESPRYSINASNGSSITGVPLAKIPKRRYFIFIICNIHVFLLIFPTFLLIL